MLVKKSNLNVDLAKNFAWLLREDVRANCSSIKDEKFLQWWIIKGRQEFPGWANNEPSDAILSMFDTSGVAEVAGVQFQIPRLVSLMAQYRLDAIAEFTQDGKLNNELFFAWVVVRGLKEHMLIEHVPMKLMAELDQSLPMTMPTSDAQEEMPSISLLMYLVWVLMDEKTKKTYIPFTAAGRKLFFPWFFSVVKPLGIESLIAGRWRSWLQGPVFTAQDSLTIPRFSKMVWQVSDEMKKNIRLDVKGDILKLNNWASKVITDNSSWGWLQNSSRVVNSVLEDAVSNIKKPFGLNIYGFAYGELGIGEDLRMAVASCEAAGIPYHIVNVDAGGGLRQQDRLLEKKIGELGDITPPYAINVFCLPAFDMVSRVFMQKGAKALNGYYNIGWWPWELAVFPKAWQSYVFEIIDEIWASSEFLLEMYAQSTYKPVKLVPLAVSVDRVKKIKRSQLSLPEGKFLFLFIFDFNSTVSRKNPLATIKAFKKSFPISDKSVCLVLKVMNPKIVNKDYKLFLDECQEDERIIIISETLDRSDLLGLINVCDAYISLHRAEGFGRTLAEALLFGKPVIATAYSGNNDYMHFDCCHSVLYELIPVVSGQYQWVEHQDGALWADVHIDSAVEKMQTVRLTVSKTKKKTMEKIVETFSCHRIGKIISSALPTPN